ncbi:hypothetical protein C7M84_022042 [Penaeus vannamei]|uniref:C2 domain-containing protein n=1 Tax=Penaeus vannamei TaxID=6689 RepID=A0A423U7S8_PENVA|nr:hypothetical protein C7M84_022042 [Penaeus vannamei]
MIGMLVEGCQPDRLVAVSTEIPPGVPRENIVRNLQMFTRVWRAKVPATMNHSTFNQYFDKILQSVYFKVRKLAPCILAGLQINVELPEEDELQISLLGMVLGEGNPAQSVQGGSQSGTLDVPFKKSKQESRDVQAIHIINNNCAINAIYFIRCIHELLHFLSTVIHQIQE